jgi:Bacterial Ig domain
MRHFSTVWLLCIVLAACGGGGGSPSAPPTSSTPTPQQLAAARSAKLTATLNTANQQATLAWSDTFPAGTSYSIEQQASDGSWSSLDAVPGTTGTGAALSWTRTINSAATLRVSVPETGYSVPLDTPSGNTSVMVAPPATIPSIALSQAQPVSGSITLSIAGGSTYSEVQWFVDLNSIGTSTADPGYSIVLNTSTLTAGSHLILAQLESSSDSYLQIRLTIQVQNPEVTVNASVSGTSGTVYLNVNATSASGIVSVSATLDGNSLGTLTAPNCSGRGCSSAYQFAINATAAGSGTHTVSVEATDGNGVSASQTFQVTFNDPPSLTVTTPFDGALVYGTLAIAGTFATDKPGVTVSVSATLGSVTVLNATSSPFSGSFNLTGVNPGTYTLTVVATDSTGLTTTVTDSVTVTSSPSLAYTPVLTLGANGSILAVSGSNILYQDPSGDIHVHTPSSDTIISLGALTNPAGWQITDGGYVFVAAFGNDRPGGSASVYMWTPGATTATDISLAAGSTSIYDELLPVHFPWVLWASFETSTWSQYTLYNVTTGQNITVPEPPGATLVGNDNCDFATINGNLALFFWAEFPNASLQNITNVYSWSQATGTTTQLSSDGLSLGPQTDGTTVAWQTDHAALPPNPPFTLSTENIASGSTATLSTNMTNFQLNAGVLGWLEQTGTTQAIKASNGTTTSTLTNLLSGVLFGSSGGYVAYEQGGQLYDWSPAGGSVLLFNAAPSQVHLAGSTIYFTNGASQAVYAVPMH